jgi:hypothetical protein
MLKEKLKCITVMHFSFVVRGGIEPPTQGFSELVPV